MSVYKVIIYNPFDFNQKIWESDFNTSLKNIYNDFKREYPCSIITFSVLKNVNLNRNVRDSQYIKIITKYSKLFSNKKINELQKLCKKYNIISSGKKYDLCIRLEDVQKYKDHADNKLRDLCKENCLSVDGKRDLLISRILKNDKIKIHNENQLKRLIIEKQKIIVMIYAKWCKKCKKQLNIYKKLKKENLYIMNIDDIISQNYVNELEEPPLFLVFNNNILEKKTNNFNEIN